MYIYMYIQIYVSIKGSKMGAPNRESEEYSRSIIGTSGLR